MRLNKQKPKGRKFDPRPGKSLRKACFNILFSLQLSERGSQLEAPLEARPPALRRAERRGDLRLGHHHQDPGQEVREGHGRGLVQRAEERPARDGHHGPESSAMVGRIP